MATRRASSRLSTEKAPVQLNLGRLAVLALLLLAAAFYVAPLRDFFAQQDRYQREAAVLAQARTQNQTLKTQLQQMTTRAYITRQARDEFGLVPPDMQAFVVKGLPTDGRAAVDSSPPPPAPPRQSLVERLQDLWQTLLR